MAKQLLKEYIKRAIREKLAHMENIEANKEKSVYMIYKFPGLKDAFENLMSPAFARFVSSIEVIAPKPTTFRVTLSNDMDFILTYVGRKTFIAKIAGKKFNLTSLSETERGSQAIANLLELNYNTESIKDEPKQPGSAELGADIGGSGGGGGGGSFPGADMGGGGVPGEEPGAEPGGDIPPGGPEAGPESEPEFDASDVAPGVDMSAIPGEDEDKI
jgi:hypothetical protein